MTMRVLLWQILFVLTFGLGVQSVPYEILIGGDNFKFEIASEPQERKKGLSKRNNLEPNAGMVFVFRKKRILKFWMKDTWMPLSIAFLNDNGSILQIENMEPMSLKSVQSRVPCRLALEVHQNWFKNKGIKVGDALPLNYKYINQLTFSK